MPADLLNVTYPVFNAYPVTGPATSPTRLTVESRVTRVTLPGAGVTARVQVTNAGDETSGKPPPEASWVTYGTLTDAAPLLDVSGPAKFMRVLLDAGTVTAGTMECDTRAAPRVDNGQLLPLVQDRIDEIASDAITTLLDPELTPVRDDVARVKGALANTTLSALAGKGDSDGPQWVDGSRWLWQPAGTLDGGTVVTAAGTGVWVRERTPRTWNAAWFTERAVNVHGGDWGATLTYVNGLMQDGDTLLIPPGGYTTTTPVTFPVPCTIEATGAALDVNHDGIALDLRPGLGRVFVGDTYTGTTYRGTLPLVKRREARRYPDASTGVRVNNAYWPRLTLQGIYGFTTGLHLYADRADAAGRDVGVTYAQIFLGRLENFTNVRITLAANPGDGLGPNNYVTENTFYGGTFGTGTWAPGVDLGGHTHIYVDGGPKGGMCDNTLFLRPSLEGAARFGVNLQGNVRGFKVQQGRSEMPLTTTLVTYGPQTQSNTVELDGFASPALIEKVTDQGLFNAVKDNYWPHGETEFTGGRYVMHGKLAGITAPANWEPADLTHEPVQDLGYATGTVTTLNLDMSKYRRFQITTSGDLDIVNNIVAFTNPPVGDYEFELSLVQGGSTTVIQPAWATDTLRWGPHAQPVPRLYGQDHYRIRRFAGAYYVTAHWRT